MNKTGKTRVAVIYGGRSSEHDVSLESAKSALANLDRTRFEPVPIAIDREGVWHAQDLALIDGSTAPTLPVDSAAMQVHMDAFPADHRLDSHGGAHIDVVLPMVHGQLCEDGCLQGLFEMADVAYVGARVLGSALSMDKDVAKRLVQAAGLQVAPYVVVTDGGWRTEASSLRARIATELGYPSFVKPANTGSSIGISRVGREAELDEAVERALGYDDKILVERAVDAREIELAVLSPLDDAAPPEVSLPGEVVPQGGFYSYEHKYQLQDGAQLIAPAELDPEQTRQARQAAAQAFSALECEGLARIDFFLERGTDRLLFNEANTLPGFTRISMYPRLWEVSGLPYGALLSRLIDHALARHARRSRLKRDR